MKKYYECIITTKDGRSFDNPLALSELHLLRTVLKENESVKISLKECSEKYYNVMFIKYFLLPKKTS